MKSHPCLPTVISPGRLRLALQHGVESRIIEQSFCAHLRVTVNSSLKQFARISPAFPELLLAVLSLNDLLPGQDRLFSTP